MNSLTDFLRCLGDDLQDRIGLSAADILRVKPEYRETTIPKKTGGFRDISIPSPELLTVQQNLYRNVLRLLPKSKHAMGFVPGRSIAMHAAIHASRQCVIRVDIKDFFPATSNARVAETFRGFGWSEDSIQAILHLCCHPTKGGLPQGAPTSPALSNIVNAHLDNTLAKLSYAFETRYSRYADDLTFSTSRRFHRRSVQVAKLISIVRQILTQHSYQINDAKTKVMGAGRRQVVTGLVVNDKPQLPRHIRRRLRAADHRRRAQQQLETVIGHRPGAAMSLAQLKGWQALQAMTHEVARNTRSSWQAVCEGDLEHRLKHAGLITAAVLRLRGDQRAASGICKSLKTRDPAEPLEEESGVESFVRELVCCDVVQSYFVEALGVLDADLRAWRSRSLANISGVLIKVFSERLFFAVGVAENNVCSLIADSLDNRAAAGREPQGVARCWSGDESPDSRSLESFCRSLCDRGLKGDVWISSDSLPAMVTWLRTWGARDDAGSMVGFIRPGAVREGFGNPRDLATIEKEVQVLAESRSPHLQRIVLSRLMLRDLVNQREQSHGNQEESQQPSES